MGYPVEAEQTRVAGEVLYAQCELLRVRAIRGELMSMADDSSLNLVVLRRVAALDRYEQRALTKRRRSAKLLD